MRILTAGRRWARACALAVAAVLLTTTSCSGEGTDAAGSEIVILSGRDDSVGGQRTELVNRWNRDHKTKARIVELSGSADQQHNEMLRRRRHPTRASTCSTWT